MPAVRIDDRFNATEFEGTRIGYAETKSPDRWVEMSVYRLDGSEGWVLHRVGMSRIYHTEPTRCRTSRDSPSGDVATRSDMPDDAKPCSKCRPLAPSRLGETTQVRFEFPRHTVNRCDTPEEVIEKLTTYIDARRQRVVRVSDPVGELLEQCAINDPAFAGANKAVEHIR